MTLQRYLLGVCMGPARVQLLLKSHKRLPCPRAVTVLLSVTLSRGNSRRRFAIHLGCPCHGQGVVGVVASVAFSLFFSFS